MTTPKVRESAVRLAQVVNVVEQFERLCVQILGAPLSTVCDVAKFRAQLLDATADTYCEVLTPEEIASALAFYEGAGRALLDRRALIDELMGVRARDIFASCLSTKGDAS